MKRILWLLPLALLAACDKSGSEATPASSGASAASAKPAATAKTEPAKKPKGDKGPFASFGQFINDAGDAVLMAARGKTPDAKWGIESLDGSDAAKLEGAKRAFTTAEIEALSKKHGYLRTNVLVFPDNRVRWVNLEHRSKAHVGPTDGLDTASPVLAATTKTLIATLSGDSCKVPLLSKAEVEATPGGQYKDVQPVLDKACAAMKGKSDDWTPRYDDFTIILEVGGKVVTVRSGIRVKDGKLQLNKPRVRGG